MKRFLLLLVLTAIAHIAFAVPPGDGLFKRARHDKPVVAQETKTQRVARFQAKLNDALGLQPHQLCVLHHALLAQTDPTWPDRPAEGQPFITLREALRIILRADQLHLLVCLPNQPYFAAELTELGIRL